jgi:hypothetical protein
MRPTVGGAGYEGSHGMVLQHQRWSRRGTGGPFGGWAAGMGCLCPWEVRKASRQEAYPFKYLHMKTWCLQFKKKHESWTCIVLVTWETKLRQEDGLSPGVGGQTEQHRKTLYQKVKENRQAPGAHTCNPSYLGGTDQETHGSNPAWANSAQDPSSKNPSQKRLAHGSRCRPLSSSPRTAKKKKKKTKHGRKE